MDSLPIYGVAWQERGGGVFEGGYPNINAHYDFFGVSNISPQLFKSFKFGNGSRMSDENLVILEFKYLQNKKW